MSETHSHTWYHPKPEKKWTRRLLFLIQLGSFKELLEQGRWLESFVKFSILLLVFFCKTRVKIGSHFEFLSISWMIHESIKREEDQTKPLNLLRKSTWGNSGPGTDSIPENPDKNPAFAAIPRSSNHHIFSQNSLTQLNGLSSWLKRRRLGCI